MSLIYDLNSLCGSPYEPTTPVSYLSAKAPTLSVRKVMELTDDQAFQVFKEVRWGEGEEVTCQVCSAIGKHYFQHTRKQ